MLIVNYELAVVLCYFPVFATSLPVLEGPELIPKRILLSTS